MNATGGARFSLFAVETAVLLAAGCSINAPPPAPRSPIPSDAPQKAMELYDANKDGVLDAGEMANAPGLQAAFGNSNEVTADDIAARIAQWRILGPGRTPVAVTVTRNGQPLRDATVTFVPESFLGNQLEAAVGKTDQNGVASLSAPVTRPGDMPGVAPGFYRVHVTKPGDDIATKYNTETILGDEVPSTGGRKFDLRY